MQFIHTPLLLLGCSPAFGQTILHHIENVPTGFVTGLGSDLTGLGDVNSDGFGDFVISDPEADISFSNSGSLRAYSGADGTILWQFHGPAQNSYLSSVDAIGDLNGDGVTDLIVGAGQHAAGGVRRGHIWVLSGVNGTVLHEQLGAVNNDIFGDDVAGAGDVNGDGVADFMVSANQYQTGPGFVEVYSGADMSLLYHFNGDFTDWTRGPALGAAGDVNADGYADILVGNWKWNNVAGRVAVMSGLDGSLLYMVQGPAGEFGAALDGLGDLDGDLCSDFVVGSPTAGNHGAATVFSGRTGQVLHALAGAEALGQFPRYGNRVAGIGDVTGDGIGDLAVAALWESTVGTKAGAVQIISGADASLWFTSFGSEGGGNLGSGLAAAGDVNGDGVPDILMGEPKAYEGKAQVISGACTSGGTYNYCPLSPNSVGPGAQMGWLGSTSWMSNNLTLTVQGLPAQRPGLFFYSFAETQVPLFDGLRCVMGDSLQRIQPVQFSNAQGNVSHQLDFGLGYYAFAAGAVLKLQYWYRDPAAGLSGANLSDALSLTICH